MPEIVSEFVDVPDAHLTNLGAKGLGEPPIVPTAAAIANAIRDATGADVRSLPITREEMLRALREAEGGSGRAGGVELRRPSSLDELEPASDSRCLRAAPRSCRCCATGSSRRTRSSTCAASCRAGSTGAHRRGDDARRARGVRRGPGRAARGRRLAASPQLRNVGTVAGNLLQSTRCWYWRLKLPCRLHGGDTCLARDGEHREHAIFANDFCASAHPSDLAAALLALGATLRTNRRELPVAELYRLPTEDDRRTTTLEPGELILRARRAAGRRVGLPEGDGAQALGVPDRRRRRRAARRRRRASRSPAWRRSRGCSTARLDEATPLPGNAYKVEIAAALVRRALRAVGSS